MYKKNSPHKSEGSTGCVRETPHIKTVSMGCVIETSRIKMNPAWDV